MEFKRKRKAVQDDMKGEGSRGSTVGMDEESTIESVSSGDQLRREE